MFRRVHPSVLILLMVLCVPTASAQNASLSGLVQDPQSRVIAGATITVTGADTGLKRIVTSNSEGLYFVPSLQPGRYIVLVQMQGFQTASRGNVVLEVEQNARLDFTLQVGSVDQTVTVSGGLPLVNTVDATVSTIVDRKFVENLPLNGRSFQSLMLLTPGVATNSPQSGAQVGISGEVTVNGQRLESNRFSVDGVSANNSPFIYGYATAGTGGGLPTGTATGTTQSLVSVDALQEFRVLSSSYSAEFGRSPGGQFSFVTRSGTNALHGTLFDYLRNDVLDANDWFNNRFRVATPKERQNDFGGTFGGPLFIPHVYDGRDRTFFFFSYEGLRLRQPIPATLAYVPSLALRQQAPVALQGALNAYPLPNGAALSNGLSEYLYTDSVPSNLDSTSIRVDHNVGSLLRLFFRYADTPSASVQRYATVYQSRQFHPRTYTFGANSLFSSRLSNELRLGYSSNEAVSSYSYLNRDGAKPTDLFQQQGIDLKANPNAYFTFYFIPGSYYTYVGIDSQTTPQTQWNVTDAVSLVAGRHQFKFGVDLLRTASDLQRTDPYAYIQFSSISQITANQGFGYVGRYARFHPVYATFSAFGQDEWRLTQRLNLSLGLRWDVSPAPSVSSGELPRVLSGSVTQPSSLALAPAGTALWRTTYKNFAPRFGAAYVIHNSPEYQTVLRGGVGVFFDNGQNFRESAFDTNPGANYAQSYANASFPLAPEQMNVSLSRGLVPPYTTVTQVGDPAYPFDLPYTVQWNVSVEQAFHAVQSVTLSYVAARGRRLLEADNLNFGSQNPNVPSVLLERNATTSTYDALQAQFQRRLSRGLQAMASYTWSHSIDYGSNNASLGYKRGDSDFDLRHNFSSAISYEMPSFFKAGVAASIFRRWGLDGRFTARSSFPVTLFGNLLTDPTTGRKFYGGLDLVPGIPLYINDASLPGGRQINPAAFKTPTGSQTGSAPRNFVRGFGDTQMDVALRRDFPISEKAKLQCRLEAFNVFNHPNFGVLNTTLGNAQFGQATKMLNTSLGGLNALYQQGGPRSMQISLRLAF